MNRLRALLNPAIIVVTNGTEKHVDRTIVHPHSLSLSLGGDLLIVLFFAENPFVLCVPARGRKVSAARGGDTIILC